MNKTRLRPVLLTLCLAPAGPAALAAQECAPGSEPDCIATSQWNFSLGLGAGKRSNPLQSGRDIPLFVIPQFSYYGRRFFIDNLDLGFTLTESAAGSVSLIASPGYDRVFFYRSDLQNLFLNGVPTADAAPAGALLVTADTPGARPYPTRARKLTYLAGPEWTVKYHAVTGQIDVLREVTGRSEGYEVRAAAAVPLWKGSGSFKLNFGLTWKSAAIVNYYYGEPDGYHGEAALSPFVKLGYTRPLGGQWHLNAFVHHEHLGKSIRDSPIVQGDRVETVFVGAVYQF